MARAHFVQKAQKDNPVAKKGESYWWWQFRHGSKQYSKERPKPQQLTQSEYQSRIYDITDMLNDLGPNADMESEVENIAQELRSLAEECEEKRSNMPDSLQDAPSGSLLEERADACNAAADELENIDFSGAPTADDDCEECGGEGEVEEDCEECGGDGSYTVDGKDGEAVEQDCADCNASGRVKGDCSACGGSGKLSEEKVEEWWQEKLEEVQNVSID